MHLKNDETAALHAPANHWFTVAANLETLTLLKPYKYTLALADT